MAETIDDILARMDTIVDTCRAEPNRLGYFAALYRKVTRTIKHGIADGRFEDGPRMERLDVRFARRYLDAYDRFQRGEPTSRSWQVAFEMRDNPRLLVTHHLLLGMNAHINLDLGIAAARSCPRDELAPLQHDFDQINVILSELTDEVQQGLASVSPSMWLLKQSVRYSDKVVIDFKMGRARAGAWQVAQSLASLDPAEQVAPIEALDRRVATRGHLLCLPLGILGRTLQLIAWLERKRVVKVIDCLS